MGMSTSFTHILCEPTCHTVLNPKPILADTTYKPLHLYLVVMYANKSSSFDFSHSSFKTHMFYKTASFVSYTGSLANTCKCVEKECSVWGPLGK